MAEVKQQVISQKEMEAKVAHYRKSALVGYDAVYDQTHGRFLIAGKHGTLAGVEAVVTLDVISMLMMLSTIIPAVVVPAIVEAAKLSQATRPNLKIE
jgi:hypothetical protein